MWYTGTDLSTEGLLYFQGLEFPVLGALGYYGQVTGEVDQICAFGEEINKVRIYQGEWIGKDFLKLICCLG